MIKVNKRYTYITIFLFFVLNLVSFSLEVEDNWFKYPSEHEVTGSSIPNKNTYNSWTAVDGAIRVFDNLYSQTSENNLLQAVSGENYFAIPAESTTIPTSPKAMVSLAKDLEAGKAYDTNIWYYNGYSINSRTETTKRKIVNTKVYLAYTLPESQESSIQIDEKFLENCKEIATLVDDGSNDDWKLANLNFVSDKSGRGYLIFIPLVSADELVENAVPTYFALEQGSVSSIDEKIELYDKGVQFLGSNYLETYGENDGVVGKGESVSIRYILDNTNDCSWDHENKIKISSLRLGFIDGTTFKVIKEKDSVSEMVSPDNYKIDIQNGELNFKILNLDSTSRYIMSVDAFYEKYADESNIPGIDYTLYNYFGDKVYFNKLEKQDLSINTDSVEGDFSKRHNIISIGGETVRLGDNISVDDGWIGKDSSKKPGYKNLYFGNNSITVNASHDGWVCGYLQKGSLNDMGQYDYSWEKVFEKEIVSGDNNILFDTPDGTDIMENLILKYSINRNDVNSIEKYSGSGEVEIYKIDPMKSLDVVIEDIQDLGVPTEDSLEDFIGSGDGKFCYGEKVKYKIKISNFQNFEIRSKKITFKSTMAILDKSFLEVKDASGRDVLGKIERIENSQFVDGAYNILINSLLPNEEVYLYVKGDLLMEDFNEGDLWELSDEVRDGNILISNVSTREINNRDYGNNFSGEYSKLDEVRHYELSKANGNTLYLGNGVSYNNEILNISEDISNDGVEVPKYLGEKPIYKGNYALFIGVPNKLSIDISENAWVSVWINNEKKWKEGDSDRYHIFKGVKSTFYNKDTGKYDIEIVPPNQPGEFKTLRVRTAYNELEVSGPLTTASSGEVEDYKVAILPPLEPTVLDFEDLGIDIQGKINGANNDIVSFGEKLRYTLEVKNLINIPVEGKSIVYRTNMGTLVADSLKKVTNDGIGVTVNEVTDENTPAGSKDYEFKFDRFEKSVEGAVSKTEISFEVEVNREDETNWKLIDSFLSEGALWETRDHNLLERNYGTQDEVRHYIFQLDNGTEGKMGEEILSGENSDIFTPVNGGDGVIFPQTTKDNETVNILYENGETKLKIDVNNPGYVRAWINYEGDWEPISDIKSVSPGENDLIVRKQGILDKKFKVRVRYSLIQDDLNDPIDRAITGEVEDYEILGYELLRVKFNNNSDSTKASHEELGILTDKGVVGEKDGSYSYKEDLMYKVDIENLSEGVINNQEAILTTDIGEIVDINDLNVFIMNDYSGTLSQLREDDENRVSIEKLEDRKYKIKVSKLNSKEIIEVRFKVNLSKEYLVRNNPDSPLGDKREYVFKSTDKLEVAGRLNDSHMINLGNKDYESTLIGYNNDYVSTHFTNKARHNLVKIGEGEELIKLGNTIDGDRSKDELNASEAIGVIEKTKSTNDGVALRNIETSGAKDIINIGPWKNNGPAGEYILYNMANNILPITVTKDGYVSVWIHYINRSYNIGNDYENYRRDWDESNDFYGVYNVSAGENNIDIDLTRNEGWYKYKYWTGYHTNTKLDFCGTNTAIVRVRYGLTKSELSNVRGVATTGEVEEYKINSFMPPFKLSFSEFKDLGLDIDGEQKGAGDGVLTLEEKFEREITIENITRAKQKSKFIIFRTSMADIVDVNSFEVSGTNGNLEKSNISISKLQDDYRDAYYDGAKIREYKINIGEIDPGKTIKVKFTMEMNDNGNPFEYYRNTYAWKLFQYLRYDDRTLAFKDLGDILHDRGYNGRDNNKLKHFQFKIDGMDVSLGDSVNFGKNENDLQSGDGIASEGIKNFPRYQKKEEDREINTLYGGAKHVLDVDVSHDGYLSICTNLDGEQIWKELVSPKKVVAGINPIEFIFPNNYEGKKDVKLRVRYGAREKDVVGNGDVPIENASTGEVEDYEYRVLPPMTANFGKCEDLGVTTDIENISGTNVFGKNDGYWTKNEIIRQEIVLNNLTTSDFTEEDLSTKIIKLTSTLGEIEDVNNCNLEAKYLDGTDITENIKIYKGTQVGDYYFVLNSLKAKGEVSLKFDYKVKRENRSFNLNNYLKIVRVQNTDTGIDQDEFYNHRDVAGEYLERKLDGGYAGWHYFTKEQPHLGDKIDYKDYGWDNLYEEDSSENDGVIINQYEGIATLLSEVENTIKVTASHKGYIQLWLRNHNGGGDYKIFEKPLLVDEGENIIKFTLPIKDDSGNSFHTNVANSRLKVRYGQTLSEIALGDQYFDSAPGTGMSTGEAEEYDVRVLPPADIRFIKYEELGVEAENSKIYGIDDDNVGLGERVRQTMEVTNISDFDLDSDQMARKVVEFESNNGIIELAEDGTIDKGRLELSASKILNDGSKVDCTSDVTVEKGIDDSKYKFILNGLALDGKIEISFDYLVTKENNNRVINTLYIANSFSNIERDSTESAKEEGNKYPDFRKDYGKAETSNVINNKHYYVGEKPCLGDVVSYNDSYHEVNTEDNDGVEIRSLARYGETSESLTLFSNQWNEININKVSEEGYLKIWLDNIPIKIKENYSEEGTEKELFLIKEEEKENKKLYIYIPKDYEYITGKSLKHLIIRYSVNEKDIETYDTSAKLGEAEEYMVRVIPPIEGRFVPKVDGEIRDFGVKLNSSAGGNAGKIFGSGDDEITLRELFEEKIEFRNDLNRETQLNSVEIQSNIAYASENHDILKTSDLKEMEFLVNGQDKTEEYIKNIAIDGKKIRFDLKLGPNEVGVLRFKLKSLEEDKDNWKIINSLNISSTFQDITDENYTLSGSGRDYPVSEMNGKVYYPQFKTDCENASSTHSYTDYLFYNRKYGSHAYMIKNENITNYSNLGDLVNPETRDYQITWANSLNNSADDDTFEKSDGGIDIPKTSDGKLYLYNDANNKFHFTATEDGYVTFWLWHRTHWTGTYPWMDDHLLGKYQKYNGPYGEYTQVSTPVKVQKGENVIDLYVKDLWYENDHTDYDHQNMGTSYGVLRVKYALEADDPGLIKPVDFLLTGEVEDYKISSFNIPFTIDDIEIDDLGLENEETDSISSNNYDAKNGTLSYKEYYDYVLTMTNISTDNQVIKFNHINGDTAVAGEKIKYRKIFNKGSESNKVPVESSNISNSQATFKVEATSDGDGIITVYNIAPGEQIKIRYKAQIINEAETDYNEEGDSLTRYKKYEWYGKDEFWINRRKISLNRLSNQENVIDSKEFLLIGAGSDGNKIDNLTARDYGDGEVAVDGKIPDIYSEVRHYRATDPNVKEASVSQILHIGNFINFENEITDVSLKSDEFDGITFDHVKDEDGSNVLYSGIKNGINVNVSHDGYISFFLNKDESYIYNDNRTGSWQDDDILPIAVYRDSEIPDSEFISEPIKVTKGDNHLVIKVFDIPETIKILRVRYAAHKEDITTPLGIARSGEVEDLPIKIIPLETGFKSAEDLGVKTSLRDERLGIDDGSFLYKELYETTFTIKNDSIYDMENAKVILKSNISQVYQDNLIEEVEKGIIYYEVYDGTGNNKLSASDGTGDPEKVLSIGVTKSLDGYENKITIPKLYKQEVVTIKMKMLITDEDKENWKLKNKLEVNGEVQGTQELPYMYRDYGGGYLEGNRDADNEILHYYLKDNGNKIRLGVSSDSEEMPYNTTLDESNDPDDDGVEIFVKDSEKIIFNNLYNELKLYPSHKGYVSFWINKDDQSWDNATQLKVIDSEFNESDVLEVTPNSKYEYIAKVKAPDLINQNKYLRVRYALDKEDVEDNSTSARSGEVEEYLVKLISGIKAQFEYIRDFGVEVETVSGEKIVVGTNDRNLIPEERFLHKIRIENLTDLEQRNIKIKYETKIAEILLGDLENNPIKIYSRNSDGTETEITDEVEREITDGEGFEADQPKSLRIKPLESLGENKEYEITIGKIKPTETIYLEFYAQVVKEDEVNWALVDRVYVDGILNSTAEYQMSRDYGSGYIEGNRTLEEEARHYISKIKDDSDEIPIGLGKYPDTKTDVLDQDLEIKDRVDNGILFERDALDGRKILYSNLKNKIEITPTFSGFVTIWLNNSTTADTLSEWDIEKDIVNAKLEESMESYQVVNEVRGQYNFPNESGEISKSGIDSDNLFIQLPSFEGEEKVLRIRYSIDKKDTIATATKKGILSPLYTARTGEVEDYRVKMVSGIRAKLVSMIDRGVQPEDAKETTSLMSAQEKLDNETELDKVRVGIQDGNVSLGEVVDTVLEVKNLTPLEQNGFTQGTKNSIRIRINNGYLDTENNFIKIVNSEGEVIVNGREGEEDHRVSIEERTDAETPDGSKDYEILIDKILANETLNIYLRQHITEEFKENDGNNWIIKNKLLFVQTDSLGNVIVQPTEDTEKTMPMERDYATSLNNLDYKTEGRNYATKVGPYVSGTDSREYMKLGSSYSVEENPVDEISSDDGVSFVKEAGKNILYYGFINELGLDINNDGYVSVSISEDGNGWTESDKVQITNNEQEALELEDTTDSYNTKVTYDSSSGQKIFLKMPSKYYLGQEKRFRIRYALNSSSLEDMLAPCSSGETEDYDIKIVPGLKVDLLEEFEDEGLLLEDGITRVGAGDGKLSPTEDVIRKINLTNRTSAEQHNVRINYYTDICEVDKNYFKVLDSKTKEELTSRTVTIVEDISYAGNGKKYILTLDKILGESNKNNTEENCLGEQVEIQIRENIKTEALTSETPKAEIKWNVTDRVSFVVEYDKTNLSYTTSGIQDEASIEMLRDYGNNLLNKNSKNDLTGARHYLALTEGIKLGDEIDSEELPSDETSEDNGLIFKNDSIYNNLSNRIELKNPLPYKGYISVWLSNDATDNDYTKEILKQVEYPEGTSELILDIPQESPYLPNTKDIINSGYKYLRVRYALHREDVETPYEFARTGEVEDYKLKIVRGLDVKFDSSEIAYQGEGGNYKPMDLGFNTDEAISQVPGRDDGFIGYQEYIKHRIKITNPVDYVQINKEFRFETNVGTYVPGSLTSSKEGITFENGVMKISQMEANEIIILEFKEQVTKESEDWNLVDKIFVDEEDPTKLELINDRVYSYDFKRDYGNALIDDKTDMDVRHYLAKYDDGSGKKFVQIKSLDTDPDVDFEDLPGDEESEDTGVDFIENLEKEKILRNNFVNKIQVNVSHAGYVGVSITTEDSRTTLEDILVDNEIDKNILSAVKVEAGINIIYIKTPDIPNTDQILRVRYGLNEEDVTLGNKIGTTGEVEDYQVRVVSGLAARFIDSVNKPAAEALEIEAKISEGKLLHDLGIVIDAEGNRAGVNDGTLTMKEENIKVVEIKNLTSLSQEEPVEILLKNNVETIDTNSDRIELFRKKSGEEITKMKYPSENLKISRIDDSNDYDITIMKIDQSETFYIKLIGTVEKEPIETYEKEKKWKALSSLTLESNEVDNIEYSMERDYASILKEGEISYKGSRYYSVKLNDRQVQLGSNFDSEEEVNPEFEENDGLALSKDITDENVLVLYNNFDNAIPVNVSHNGYLKLWVSKADESVWNPLLDPSAADLFGAVNGEEIVVKVGDILARGDDQNRILRVGYSLVKDNILPTGYNQAGEVEDYEIKLVSGFKAEFGEIVDLGVPVENFDGERVGENDENISLGEYVRQKVTITNLSSLPQEDKKIRIKVNVGEIYLDNLESENLKWMEPKNKIDSIIKVTSLEPGYNEYEVNVHEIDGNETLELTYFMKVTKESKEWNEWKFREKLCDFTTDLELDTLEKDMFRDYGENFIGSYDEYSGARHYTTEGSNEAYLGETVEANVNDGVILKTKVVGENKINILHNNFTNKVTIRPNHKGYISLWLSEDSDVKTNWDSSKALNIRKITDEVPEERGVYVLEVNSGDQDIIFDVEDYIKEKAHLNKILRVRYAVHKEDVESPVGVAKTGEIEDYKIQITSGFSANFEKEAETSVKYSPKDLGIEFNEITYGENDNNFVPGEIIEHRIKIVNNNDYVQSNKEIILNSNLCKYEGLEFNFESVDASDNVISKVENIEDPALPTTYNTKITIGRIEANSSILLKVKFRIVGENLVEESKFKLQDRIIYEGYVPEFNEEDIASQRAYVGLMERDYGESIGNEAETNENIRHYITKNFYLGDSVSDEENNMTSSDNDGVIFTKDESGKENVIYNGLTNEIQIKFNENELVTTEGYISIYLDEASNSDWTNAKLLIDKQLVTKDSNVVKLEVPDYMKDGNFEAKKFRIRFAADKEELSKDYSVTGEIEDYQLKLISGLDVKFGEKSEDSYIPKDLGHVSNDGVLIGENDGNISPTEIVEHTMTIENKTNVSQENKAVYFESNIGEILLEEKIVLVTPEENGTIASIEKEEGTRKYKINISKIKDNSFITLRFKEEIKEENQEDYKLKEKVSVDNTMRDESIIDMERDYSNGKLKETEKSLHYRAGKIDETRENLYYLGDKYDVEDDYDSSDDADGIVEVNGEVLNEGDPIIFTVGIDNRIKVKHSQSGYISLWLTSSNPGTTYDWKDSKSLLGISKTFKVEGNGITEILIPKEAFDEESLSRSTFTLSELTPMDIRILRIRYSGDEEDIEKPDAYARSGETEEYEVNMKNITGTKTSITQDGDDIAEAGERITYTFNFKNNSTKNVNVVLKDDFKNALTANGFRVADIDGKSLNILTGGSYISSKIENDILTLTANGLPSNEIIEAKIDVVIRNPLSLFARDGSVLENTMELIENGVSIKVEDEEPPVLKKGKVELKSIKDFKAYRNDEIIKAKENGRVYVLPSDIVEYTIKINNDNEDTNAWSTEFEDDISDILNYSDFVSASLQVMDKDNKKVKLYMDNIDRKEVEQENISPIVDGENKKMKFVIHEIEKSNFVTISFKLKVKDSLPEETVFPKELPNEAGIINGNTSGKQELSPSTEGPILDSVLKKSKISKTSNGDRKIQLNEEITYEIMVENLSEAPVNGVVIEDSLAEILKFANVKSITYNGTDISSSLSTEDNTLNYTIKTLDKKSVGTVVIKVVSKSEIPDGVDETKVVYNEAFIKNDGIDENSSRKDEGLTFDTSTTIEKTCQDENNNDKAESGEILTYTIELYNPSVNDKNSLEVIDDLKTKMETISGDVKDISLFQVCDFIENSIELEREEKDNFSEQNLKYDKENQKIAGNVKIKGKTKIKIKFKVKVKMPIPSGVDVGDHINNLVTVNDNGIINESKTDIPIDYEIIIKFKSQDYTGDNIAETGEEVKYTVTIINPYNRDVKVDIENLLNQQQNSNISLMNDITYFSKYVDGSLVVTGATDFETTVKEDSDRRKIGISGIFQVPPMGVEGKEKVDVDFKIKINEDLPEDLEEEIDKLVNNSNLKEEGVPIENEIVAKEERGTSIVVENEKLLSNFEGTVVPDPEPPLLQAMIRDKVVKISKRANKDKASVGDLIAYELEVENQRERGNVPKIYIEDKLPPGFRYVKGSARIYRKDGTGKYVKETIVPTHRGRVMEFFIRKLMEKENLKITYLLRVGVGVSPNMYENIAVVKNDHKPDREEISNTARAVVEVLLDRLFDMSTVIGKVFHDRDGDGWQDDATLYDLKIKTITNMENYFNLDDFYIKNNEDDSWKKILIKKGKIGNLQGRTRRINRVPSITLRRKIKDPNKISNLEISSQNSLILELDSTKEIKEIKKGIFARGESGGELKVNRRIIEKDNEYYEEINLYNLGIYEEGIPGVKISTVSGLVVTTDQYGRYHIENIPLESIRGNNYILKVDPVTLPRGSKFTTKNPLLKRINHVMTKFNFGVKFKTDD
ncbi:isopeptide-forming domain-containing fimbrial protein [Fusobacterium sp. MFO224]|uniref:isopeptide-forming domain-containing fimbrial protein n=1 Tax=Fusobacterium sp. MFO224 TaxID=3378070 RepID=UPI003852B30F